MMEKASLGSLVVRLALELENYKAAWKEAEATTAGAAASIGQQAQQAEGDAQKLLGTLERQVKTFGASAAEIRRYDAARVKATVSEREAIDVLLGSLDALERQKDAQERLGSAAHATGVAIGAAAGSAAVALGMMVKSAIDNADAVGKLSAKTGIATETLSAYEYAARLSNVSSHTLENALRTLSKQIAGNSDTLTRMGIATRDSDGKLRSLDAVLDDVADRFAGYKDGAAKATAAQELFGQAMGHGGSGVDMINMLNDGSAGMRAMREEAQRLGVVIGGDLAAQAAAFNDNVTRLKANTSGWTLHLAQQLLPLLVQLTDDMAANGRGAGELAGAVSPVTETLRALVVMGGNVSFVLKGVGTEIGGIAAQAAALGRGDIAGAIAIGREMKADAEKGRAAFDEWERRMMSAGKTAAKVREEIAKGDAPTKPPREVMDAWEGWVKRARTSAERLKEDIAEMRKAGIEAGKTIAEVDRLEQRMRENAAKGGGSAARKAAAEEAKELEQQRRLLSELSGLTASFAGDWDRLSAMFAQGKLTTEQLTKAQADLLAKQPAIRAHTQELAKETERLAKANEAAAKAHESHIAELTKGVDKLQQEIDKQREHNATLGMSKQAVAELDAAKLEEQATSLEGLAIRKYEKDLDDGLYDLRMREAAQLRELAQLKREGSIKEAGIDAAKEAQKAWKETGEFIERTLLDAVQDGLREGEHFSKAFFKSLEATAKTTVLRFGVQLVGQGLTGMVGSVMGGGNAAPAASLLNGIGTAGAIYNAAQLGYAGTIGSGVGMFAGTTAGNAALGTALGLGEGSAIAAATSAAEAAGASSAAAASAASLGATVATAIPYLAVAALAISALSKGGETRSGGKYINGSFLEGPSGGEINGDATRTAIGATMVSINAMLKQLGATSTLAGLESGFEASQKGKGFAYAGGTLSTGATFGQTTGLGYLNRRGTMSPEQAAAAFGEELKQATLQALQAANVPGQLGDYLRSLGDIDKLSGGALDAAIAKIQKALTEKAQLEDRYFELTHTALEVATRDRQRERDALDESNRARYDEIAALEDQKTATEAAARAQEEATRAQEEAARAQEEAARAAEQAAEEAHRALVDSVTGGTDAAYAALQRAVGAQRDAAEVQLGIAQEQVSALQGLSEMLKREVASLYGESASAMLAASGRQFIEDAWRAALSTGYLPDQAELADAIAGARGGMGDANYNSAFEATRDRLVLAGKLSQIKDVSGHQLTTAEKQLQAAKDQIKDLDGILKSAHDQIDALRGIDTSVLSVAAAIDRLAAALAREAAVTGGSLTGGLSEQWVKTATGQMWQSSGGAVGSATASGFTVTGKSGTSFSGDSLRDWVNAQAADPMQAYLGALKEGISANTLDHLMGWADGTSNTWADNVGVPRFADGGWHEGGWAMVGERGRELRYMPPSRIYSNAQTEQMLGQGGGDNRAQQAALDRLCDLQRTSLTLTNRLLKKIEAWDGAGMPPPRTAGSVS